MNSSLKTITKNGLDEAYSILMENGHSYCECSIYEFFNYLTGDTFTGDTATIFDILEKIYYIIHEVVEICFLKKSEINIDKKTVVTSPRELIYRAHFKAIDVEFDVALKRGDYQWVCERLKIHSRHLSEDEFMPTNLNKEGKELYLKYEKILRIND